MVKRNGEKYCCIFDCLVQYLHILGLVSFASPLCFFTFCRATLRLALALGQWAPSLDILRRHGRVIDFVDPKMRCRGHNGRDRRSRAIRLKSEFAFLLFAPVHSMGDAVFLIRFCPFSTSV